jgi:tetratricopeptide (TPR) repeat protein
MNAAASWVVRGLVVGVCVFFSARSVRIAVADMRAQHNGLEGVESALRLEPGDSVLLARGALALSQSGDMSEDVDRQLRNAAAADPFNADLPIALGLREEFRGHLPEAERYLTRATDIDHTFKPAWTLANFYFRNDQAEKSWPMIRRTLSLNPLAFDPGPVFDLCWNETEDPKRILDMIPTRGRIPIQYLNYLTDRRRVDAAVEAWPLAFKATDPASKADVAVLTGLTDLLLQTDRTPKAIRIWNQLVESRIVASGRLDPAAGISIADPDFSFPLIERGFSWHVSHESRVSVVKGSSSLRFDFDGNQPEKAGLLVTLAPLVPARSYRLVWKTDASRLSAPNDTGFAFRLIRQPGNAITECPPLLQDGDNGSCAFTSLPNEDGARLELWYQRVTGTTRVRGTLVISTVRLEFGS